MCSSSVCASGARHAQPVQRRDAHRAGEIAVRTAAGALRSDGEAERLGDRRAPFRTAPCLLASGSHTGRVTPRVTWNCTSFDEARSASMAATPRSRSSCRFAMDSASPVQVVVTQLTHWPPWITPTLKVQSSRGHVLDLDQLAGHLADRRAALGQARAGVAGAAGGLQVEAGDGVAAGDDAAVGARRFRDQHVFMARGLGLDQVAGRGAADLLVAGEQHGDRQVRARCRRG